MNLDPLGKLSCFRPSPSHVAGILPADPPVVLKVQESVPLTLDDLLDAWQQGELQ